ncbi:uncharacterized protein Tco_1473430 [Tanacetum coccineum]
MVRDASNIFYEGNDVADAFVKHYESFLGSAGNVSLLDDHDLYERVLDTSKADNMVRGVMDSEIKNAMFSMRDDKASGLDGFTAVFFKKAWDVVGTDITCAIRDFFANGKLLKELNHTIISLIPKVTTPARINDYRPISCCNVLYKCISKIIANRLKEYLGDLHGPPRCAFKVDIQKAYDIVDWSFLKTILMGFGFHTTMVQWIMACVTGASFSVCVNGNLHGRFNGKRGLRQGDPLSPYLFILVMEVLTLILQRRFVILMLSGIIIYVIVRGSLNLCFADDLFLFARGHPSSVSVFMEALEEFKNVSGLVLSIPKSTTFFCNVPNAIKAAIISSMPFAEGTLPVRYLGVPLISSRLLYHDCKVLVEKLEDRVNDWRNKFLSLAGRVQLIRSVLSSMHIYWASMFILPVRIIHDLNQLMLGFLWCQGEMKKGKAKVAWNSVYNGKSTSVWFDKWAEECPLKNMLSNRDIIWDDLSINDSLSDDREDVVVWRDVKGEFRPFFVTCVWDTIRMRANVVDWYHVVWFPHCIPQHAIHMWLVIQQKLKTQDRLRQWDVGPSIHLNLLRCPLCDLVPDYHDHLFFECSFSSQVWSKVHVLCDMDSISPWFTDVIAFITPISKGKMVVSILSRIMVAATSYYIWQERKGRLFKKKTSSPDYTSYSIYGAVEVGYF